MAQRRQRTSTLHVEPVHRATEHAANLYGLRSTQKHHPIRSIRLSTTRSAARTYQDFRNSVSFNQRLTQKLCGNARIHVLLRRLQQHGAEHVPGTHRVRPTAFAITKDFGAHGGYGHTTTDYDNVGSAPSGNYSGGTMDAGVRLQQGAFADAPDVAGFWHWDFRNPSFGDDSQLFVHRDT